jgi:predicted PurR-regulated permease PerM
LALTCIIIIPILYNQLVNLLKSLPQYVSIFEEHVVPDLSQFFRILYFKLKQSIATFFADFIKHGVGSSIAGSIVSSGIVFINTISLLVISPIVSFYLIRDWRKMYNKILSIVPQKYNSNVIVLTKEIRRKLSGYLSGQINVIIFLMVFYGLSLSIVGLRFGLLIGITTGILNIIPYIGIGVSTITAVLIAFFTYDNEYWVFVVLGIFVVGQFIEGNFITPRIVGSRVGLHPLWIIFGLLAGGALLGFFGILFAIPITVVCGVLIRFYVQRYRKSSYYTD